MHNTWSNSNKSLCIDGKLCKMIYFFLQRQVHKVLELEVIRYDDYTQ